jgi:hypothetical protein
MKVLQIIPNLKTGGAEKLLIDSLPYYFDYNIYVDLFLLDGEDTPFLQLIIKEKSFIGNSSFASC